MTLGIDCLAGKRCLLSHKPSPETLPTCLFFLEGRCKRSNCTFAHTLVGPKAEACAAFAILGYCERGEKCPQRHLRQCPDYVWKGACGNPRCCLSHADTNYKSTLLMDSDTRFRSDTVGMTASDDQVDDGPSLVASPALETHHEANGVTMQMEFIQQQDFIRL